MLIGMLDRAISINAIRAAGVLALLIDPDEARFRRGGLGDVVSVLARSLFYRNAEAIDAATWLDPKLEALVAEIGAKLA